MSRPVLPTTSPLIRARMEELRREREGTKLSEREAQRDQPMPRGAIRWPPAISAGPGRARQSGPIGC
jgi:hypothetical protein